MTLTHTVSLMSKKNTIPNHHSKLERNEVTIKVPFSINICGHPVATTHNVRLITVNIFIWQSDVMKMYVHCRENSQVDWVAGFTCHKSFVPRLRTTRDVDEPLIV